MHSMTGMGRAAGIVLSAATRVEVKSVNHRYCDVVCRLPGRYQIIEVPIQQFVRENIARGKVDVFVAEDKGSVATPLDIAAYRACHSYLKSLKETLGLAGELTLQELLSAAGTWMVREADSDRLWGEFRPILKTALDDLKRMRAEEGANLRREMEKSLARVSAVTEDIASRREPLRNNIEKRLTDKILSRARELGAVDPARLQMETLFWLDRMDIAEELQRLGSHIAQMRTFLSDAAPSGRRIDFLLQEFNREFNTIASKVQDGEASHLVVTAKVELERLREQAQNIE